MKVRDDDQEKMYRVQIDISRFYIRVESSCCVDCGRQMVAGMAKAMKKSTSYSE